MLQADTTITFILSENSVLEMFAKGKTEHSEPCCSSDASWDVSTPWLGINEKTTVVSDWRKSEGSLNTT